VYAGKEFLRPNISLLTCHLYQNP